MHLTQKSLAIPNKTPPDAYKAYVEHPEIATLNQVMLHYLEMEEILKLYRHNHEHTVGRRFETRQALDTLAQRFELPAATDFKQLLRAYDMQYATVRSYLYNNRGSTQILMHAASEGNIQAFYNQLKLYSELRKEFVYTTALCYAAQGGHEDIVELLFDLGVEDKDEVVFRYAVIGGQLALVQKELAKEFESKNIEVAVSDAAKYQHKDVLAVLLDYRTTDQILAAAMTGAGRSGDNDIISYVISRGGNDYPALIESAAMHGHFDVVRQYWDKLSDNHTRLNNNVFYYAIENENLATVKFIVERHLIFGQDRLKGPLEYLMNRRGSLLAYKQSTSKHYKQVALVDSIIAYLESKGIVGNVETADGYMSD